MDQKDDIKKPSVLVPVILVTIGLVLIVGSLIWWLYDRKSNDTVNTEVEITSFQACKDAGGVIAESYPEQCFVGDKSFTNPDQEVFNDEDYAGLTEQEALDIADKEGRAARVVERNGEALPVTMDFVEGRLNFSIEDGKVSKVHVEMLD